MSSSSQPSQRMSADHDEAAERETLLPNDTPLLQNPESPMRMNIISGTAILSQFGIWLILLTVWYSILTTPIILASFHPLANSLALLFLVNGILLLQSTHTQSQKVLGAKSHSVLNVLAIASFLTGAISIWVNKSNHGAPHFTSVHGKFGLITVSLIFIQLIIGIVQFYVPNLLGGEANAKRLYKWHRVSGYLIAALAIVTVTLGTQTDWYLGKVRVLWIWIVFDVLIVVGLVPRIKPSKMKLF